MIVYNKLVRDKIIDIIESSGKSADYCVLKDEDYLRQLRLKLKEELREYDENHALEELIDILEIIYAIAAFEGVTITELEQMRIKKREERGGFERKLYLLAVTDNNFMGWNP